MNTRKVLIGSAVAAGVMAGAFVAWSTASPRAPSYAAGVVARHVHFAGRGHRHGHARGLAMICSERRDQRIADALAFVEGFANFTPEQAAAWAGLTETIRAGSASIGAKCAELEEAGSPKTAPEGLARFEALATTGLDILQSIRPAFERFYATLSDQQKEALDDLVTHRGRRS